MLNREGWRVFVEIDNCPLGGAHDPKTGGGKNCHLSGDPRR